MVETLGVGVAIYGADGVYRYVNDAYAKTFDVSRDELVGTACLDSDDPADATLELVDDVQVEADSGQL